MMDVTFRCPRCDQAASVQLNGAAREIACPKCQSKWPAPGGALADGQLRQCLICGSTELFIRKDFSQRVGVAIVVLGFVVSSIFWYYRMPLWTYGVLFATALIDVVLYFTVGDLLECYRCQTQYRGIAGLKNHEPFDLQTHEKHRQQRIRLKQETRTG
jgi:DNA-directed RNA polymerase subunit RPC12/RpoP